MHQLTEDDNVIEMLSKVSLDSSYSDVESMTSFLSNGHMYDFVLLQSAEENVYKDKSIILACLVKVTIAYAILKISQENKLNLDDNICKWFKGISRKECGDLSPIKVRHLLNHSSGIDDSAINFNCYSITDNYKEMKRIAEPGKYFSYSTFGYILLAHIIEQVCNKPWLEAIQRYVCYPLGITLAEGQDSKPDAHPAGDSSEGRTGRAWISGATSIDRYVEPAQSTRLAVTRRDIVKLAYPLVSNGNSLEGGKYFSEETMKRFARDQIKVHGHYLFSSAAYGWFLFKNGLYGFFTGVKGTNTYISIDPFSEGVLVSQSLVAPNMSYLQDITLAAYSLPFLPEENPNNLLCLSVCTGHYESSAMRADIYQRGDKYIVVVSYFDSKEAKRTREGCLAYNKYGAYFDMSGTFYIGETFSFLGENAEGRPSYLKIGTSSILRRVSE